MQEELNQIERNQVWHLVSSPMIDQLLVLNGYLGISWMRQEILLGIKLGYWHKVTPKLKGSILRKSLHP